MESLRELMAEPPKKKIEIKTCISCGNYFDAIIYILKDRQLDADLLCPGCKKDKRNQEQISLYNEKLERVQSERRIKWSESYGVNGIFKDKTFDNFNSEYQPQAYQAVRNYKDQSLILISPDIYGVGKTHLVTALANHLINTLEPAAFEKGCYQIRTAPCPVFFTVETSLLARIRDTFNSNAAETEELVYRQLASYPLLIVDDVGKVRPRDMSFLQSVYFRIIDQRYVEKKQIILTTNLDAGKLADHIGGACADRLFEMCGANGFVYLDGASYRHRIGNIKKGGF